MTQYNKPEISSIAAMETEQVFAKKSGNNSNNGRFGSGNENSNNGGNGIGSWTGGKNHDNFDGKNNGKQ